MNRFKYLLVAILTLLTLYLSLSGTRRRSDSVLRTAYWPTEGQCVDAQGAGADYAVHMTGDLEGCHYTFIETYICSQGGGYNEKGHEVFCRFA